MAIMDLTMATMTISSNHESAGTEHRCFCQHLDKPECLLSASPTVIENFTAAEKSYDVDVGFNEGEDYSFTLMYFSNSAARSFSLNGLQMLAVKPYKVGFDIMGSTA